MGYFLSKIKAFVLNITYNYHNTHFLMSIANVNYLPVDDYHEVAFIGYSNVGKSSMLNALTRRNNLAKISKTPGCTKLINLFKVDTGARLVDLPGYGYAKASKKIKCNWKYLLYEYLYKRKNLKGIVLLMDIRHPLKNIDQQIIYWAINVTMPILILLTKMDKLSYYKSNMILTKLRNEFTDLNITIKIELFSSINKYGLNKLQQQLNLWLSNNND